MHTGQLIRHLRKSKSLSQEELGEIVGVQKSAIAKYENGRVKNLKRDTTTKNTIISYVKAVFKYANTFYNVPNISEVLKPFKKSIEELKPNDVWTIDEFNQFISSVKHPVYNAFFHTLYHTGMRRGEGIALLKDDFKEDRLFISKSMKHLKQGFKPPKTYNAIRDIKLDNVTIDKLKDLMKIPGNFLFGGDTSLPITSIDREFKQGIKLSGVKPIRLHDLRHSHATNLINNGANIVAVSKRLGHSDINITLSTYTHLLKKSEDELVKIINNM